MRYFAYGLRIVSDLPIPELDCLQGGEGESEVHVRFDGAPYEAHDTLRWIAPFELIDGEQWLRCARSSDGYFISFPRLADFSITRDGRSVACHAAQFDRTSETLRHLFLDQVMPLALKLRGREALHATAVLTPASVCAFVGPPGCGKSTLAASFLRAGFQTLCDDCLLVAPDEPVTVTPGYPGVRLCDDAFAALAEGAGHVSAVASYTTKRRWRPASDRFPPGPRPLERIYRLMGPSTARPGVRRRLEPLSCREAFMELVAATFRLDITDRRAFRREFRSLERIARAVPMRRLWLDDDLRSCAAIDEILGDLP